MTHARGKYAKAICDICGHTCDYLELKAVVRDSYDTGLRSCKDCFDPDHPQNHVDELVVSDNISLQNPRPDVPREPFTDTDFTPPLSDLYLDQ